MSHDAAGIDDDCGPICKAHFLLVDAQALRKGTLRMEVGQQRVGDAAKAAAKVGVHRSTIDAHAQGLSVAFCKSF